MDEFDSTRESALDSLEHAQLFLEEKAIKETEGQCQTIVAAHAKQHEVLTVLKEVRVPLQEVINDTKKRRYSVQSDMVFNR